MKVTTDLGCVFAGSVKDGVIVANQAPCDPLAPNSILASQCVEAQTKISVHLDAKNGTFHDFDTNDSCSYDAIVRDVKDQNYVTCEGRITDGRAKSAGVALIQYDGGVAFPLEQSASLGCPPIPSSDNAPTSGTLIVRYGQSHNELVVYEEGVGCTTVAKSADGVIYRADDTACQLAGTGIAELGVTSRRFTTFVLDFGAKTWNYESTILRNDVGETEQVSCYRLHAKLVGDLNM